MDKGVIRGALASLAVLGLCVPQSAFAAAASVNRAPAVTDVVLMDGGVLVGQVVDPQGVALAKVPVSLRGRDREVARTATDRNGYFAVRGLHTGVYQLVGAKSHRAYRLWTPGNAPPMSQRGALLVAGEDTVRGQAGSLAFWLANPWVVAGVLATAVAVPVVVHNAERPSSP